MKIRRLPLPIAILSATLALLIVSVPASTQVLGINSTGSTTYPTQGLRRVAKVVLSSNNYQGLYTAGIDAAGGYAYFMGRLGSLSKINLTNFSEESTITGLGQGYVSVIDKANGYAYFSAPPNIYKIKLTAAGVPPAVLATFSPGANCYGGFGDLSDPDPTKHYAYFITTTKPATVFKYLLPSPSGGDADSKAPTLVGPGLVLNSPSFPTSGFSYRGTADTVSGYGYFGGWGSNQICKIAFNGALPPTEVGVATTSDVTYTAYGLPPDVDTSGPTHYAYFNSYSNTLANVVKLNLSSFSQVANTSFRPGTGACNGVNAMEQMLSFGVADHASNSSIYVTDGVFPMKVFKVKDGAGDAAPVENAGPPLQLLPGTSATACDGNPAAGDVSSDGGLTFNFGEVYAQGTVIDNAAGYVYIGTDSAPGQIIKVAFSQKAAIKGSQITLAATSTLTNLNFYSSAAGGHVRLAVYDDGSPKQLLWDSGSFNNTAAGWVSVAVAAGAPTSLTLAPGTYWLCWQVDSTLDIPSYTAGAAGTGFVADAAFGAYPASLAGVTGTAENWSVYADLAPLGSPTPTFTATATGTPVAVSPTNSPTSTASVSPTATPSASPTATPSRTASGSATASPSVMASATASPSASPTASASASPSTTATASPSGTPSCSPTSTTSASPSGTPTASPSATPSFSASPTALGTYTATPTPTVTQTFTASPSAGSTSVPTAAGAVLPGQIYSYPNPAVPGKPVTVVFEACDQAELSVFDWAGHKVFTLDASLVHAAAGLATWDGRNAQGQDLASGLYFLALKTGQKTLVHKFTVLRP